jgi:hypothetical protein
MDSIFSLRNINVPILEIQSTSTDYARLFSIEFICQKTNSTFYEYGIGVPAVKGVIRPSAIPFQLHDPNSPPCLVSVGVDWATLPTAPVNYYRRVAINAAGSGIPTLIQWRGGLGIPPLGSLVLWFIQAGGSTYSAFTDTYEINLEIDV